MVNWKEIEYFKPEEFNYPDRISVELIKKLDQLRSELNLPIIINKGTGKSDYRPNGHPYHNVGGECQAVDFHVKGAGRTTDELRLPDLLIAANKVGFNGIGMYPEWRHPGLHCDIRKKPAYWININDEYHYI